MVKDRVFWEAWEAQYIANEPVDFQRNLRLMNAMYEHARSMGAFPLKNPLSGLEDKIRLGRMINSLPDLLPGDWETLRKLLLPAAGE
ncbi:MAG TPA: hypothetical protein VKM93_10485 [Terriglobia bacterium]|nr:hypothetical protein [Terriglobia bacterium]